MSDLQVIGVKRVRTFQICQHRGLAMYLLNFNRPRLLKNPSRVTTAIYFPG